MTVQFEAQLDGFDSTYNVISTQFITFRLCGNGEVLKDNICQQCPIGSYSFAYDPLQTCRPCPSSASGCLGSQISVPQGYWRLSSLSDLILPCPYPKGCKGSFLNYTGSSLSGSGGLTSAGVTTVSSSRRKLAITTTNEYCAVGYEGPLCAVCSKGYYLDYGLKACQTCNGQVDFVAFPTLLLYSEFYLYFYPHLFLTFYCHYFLHRRELVNWQD